MDNPSNAPPVTIVKTGPSWTQVGLIAIVIGLASYIITDKYHSSGKVADPAESRAPDAAVVRLGKDSMASAQKAPYEAVLQASALDLDSTAEYAAMIHGTLNKRYDAAWSKWSDEMTSRFGATSDTKLSPTKQRELRDYLADLATGIKQTIK